MFYNLLNESSVRYDDNVSVQILTTRKDRMIENG